MFVDGKPYGKPDVLNTYKTKKKKLFLVYILPLWQNGEEQWFYV